MCFMSWGSSIVMKTKHPLSHSERRRRLWERVGVRARGCHPSVPQTNPHPNPLPGAAVSFELGEGKLGCRGVVSERSARCIVAVVFAFLLLAGPALGEGGRIISLAPSITETIFALGAGDRLAGVSVHCDYPPEALRIDKVGTFLTPNIEAIIAKKPDVVLVLPSPGNRAPIETLQRLGIRVLVLDARNVHDILESFVTIGTAIGLEAAGRRLAAQTEEHLAAIRQRLAASPERRVLMVVGQTPLVAVGDGTYQNELLQMTRGRNVAATVGGTWPRISIEAVLAAAPEVIIDTTMGSEERLGGAELLSFWKQYPTLPAVRAGHVYGYRSDELLRPGPRLPEALETLARFIHPEVFDASPATEKAP